MSIRRMKRGIVSAFLAFAVAFTVFLNTLAVGAESYSTWKQYDARWSTITLGRSGENMKQIGCAVTAVAMLMRLSGAVEDESFTPAVLVRYLNENGGFDARGNLQWNVLTKYAPDFVYAGRDDSLRGCTQQQITEKIRELSAEGYYLLVNVNYGGHFVAVESVSGSFVRIMDPNGDNTSLFGKYDTPGIYSLRKFRVTGQNVSSGTVTEMAPAPFPGMENPPAPEMTNPPAPDPEDPPAPDPADPPAPEPETPPAPEPENPPAPEPETPPAPEQETVPVTEAVTEPTDPPVPEPTDPPAPTEPAAPALPETEPELGPPVMQPEPELKFPEGLAEEDYVSIALDIVSGKTLVLRELPAADASGIGIVLEGTELVTVRIAADNSWAQVVYQDMVGWIPLEYILF